jgi:hypothetical protein
VTAGKAGPRADAKKDNKEPNALANKPAASGAGQASGAPASRNERLQDRAGSSADLKLAEEKDKANEALFGWARTRHEEVIALVKSSNCRAAATAAVQIYNRAPDYYAANVATDRSVKPCLPYITSERQREDRARAVKRANAIEAPPAQAAPPAPVKK